jgi:MoaD family protein
MVKVKVVLYGTLASIAGEKEIEVDASPIKKVLHALTAKFGEDLNRRLFDTHGNPRRFLNIYVNGRDMRFLDKLETKLEEGDVVTLIPAVSGG